MEFLTDLMQLLVTGTALAGAIVSFRLFARWSVPPTPEAGEKDLGQPHARGVGDIVEKGGALAKAFSEAGPASTAAAISVICLLLAVVGSGLAAF